MSLSVKRARALSSAACRSAQSSRLVHSSSINQATALSSTSFSEEIPEITLQPIFDIFDAPTQLSQSSEFIRNKYSSKSPSTSSPASAPKPATNGSRTAPAPLPQPILFDGPARPQNGMLAFQSRLRDAGLRAPSSSARALKNAAPTRPFSSSEPLVQMFDGPARITRYHHRPGGNEQNSAKYMVALAAVGVVGGATVLSDKEKS